MPGRCPGAKPLVQYDRCCASIGEIDVQVTAMRHILIMHENANAVLLPQQFNHRFLIKCVAPIMPDLPGLATQVVGTRRARLDDQGHLRGVRLRENPLHSVDQQARHQRRGYKGIPVGRLRDCRFRPAAALRQQLYDDLGCAGAERGEVAIEFRTNLDQLGPLRRKKRVEVDRGELRSDRCFSSGHGVADGSSPHWPRQAWLRLACRPDAAAPPSL